jgi:hypothetical protein
MKCAMTARTTVDGYAAYGYARIMSDWTKGGDPIHRHTAQKAPTRIVAHANDERIAAHLHSTLGEGMVWHEIVSDRVHIDVHFCPPNAQRPFYVLVTSGMSALPMNVPAEHPARDKMQFVELCIVLPPTWRVDQQAFADPRWFWPVRLLKELARLPHDYDTWLSYGHSIPNGDPASPYAPDTKLSGAVIITPALLGAPFFSVPGVPPLHIFQVLPVTSSEMDLKVRYGLEGLLERMDKVITPQGVYGPVNPQRPSA